MIPEQSVNTVGMSGNFDTMNFGIDNEDFSHIVDILQNQLYSNKPLALVREYSCNAYDANVAAGRKNTPIRITLPSKFNPQLIFRDFGNGLTYDEMSTIFTRYGKSTKRNDNDTVGCFGIGSKAGFSYGQSFMVNTYLNGEKTNYNCVLDESNVGKLIKMGSSKTSEDNGVEIIISIKMDDIDLFRDICMNFFKHWEVMPEIVGFSDEDYNNIRGNNKVILSGTGWKIMEKSTQYGYRSNSNAIAVMGNVAYPIDWSSVKGLDTFIENYNKDTNNARRFERFYQSNNMVFNFNIGEVKMSPSRESLQYTELTNNALISRLTVVLNEVNDIIQKDIYNCKNMWEAKKMYGNLFEGYDAYLSSFVGVTTINYKGITIKSSKIGPFCDYTFNKYPVLTTYTRMRRSGNFRERACDRYSHSSINCNDQSIILEVDTDRANYIRKAIRYLSNKHNVTTIYVLRFEDSAIRTKIFAETGLDDSFIIKYTAIHDEVKKTIVRNSYRGKTSTVNTDTSIRSLRYVHGDTNYKTNNIKELSVTYHDMTKGGIYVETINTDEIMNCKSRWYDICNSIINLKRVIGQTERVYFIGQNLIGGKLMKQGNWINFDTYMLNKVKELINSNPLYKKVIVFSRLLEDENINVFTINTSFINFLKENTNCDIIKSIVELTENKSKMLFFDAVKVYLEQCLTITDQDNQEIIDLFDNLNKKYPMFKMFNDYSESCTHYNYYGSNMELIKAYLNNGGENN